MVFTLDKLAFDGFGASLLASGAEPPAVRIALPSDRRSARRVIRRHCTATPGVYGMIDADDELIYVGKSKALRNRLLSYLAGSADSKARRIIARTRSIIYEQGPHEFAALLRELELIRRWQPRYNARGRPGRVRRAYVCLDRGPAAYAHLSGKPSGRDGRLFGPISAGRRWRTAVRRLNDCFRLRDCAHRDPATFAEQLELFPGKRVARCVRHDLGTCLAPCAAACSRREYQRQVQAAYDFLQGRDLSILGRLEQQMRQAAAERQYERAAFLRDAWEDLSRLHGQLQSLREVRNSYSFVYPLPAHQARTSWYLVRRGEVAAVARAPENRSAAARCFRILSGVYDTDGPGDAAKPEDPEMMRLVWGWFRQHPEELARVLSPDDAQRACRRMIA